MQVAGVTPKTEKTMTKAKANRIGCKIFPFFILSTSCEDNVQKNCNHKKPPMQDGLYLIFIF